jgi:hypothetical protein
VDVNELSVDNSSASHRVTIQRGRRIRRPENQPVMGCISKDVTIKLMNYGILSADQTCGILSDGAKYVL